MSLLEWVIISFACLVVFCIGYAGVTGKSVFSFKENDEHHSGK